MDDIEKAAQAESLDQEAAKHEAIAKQLRLHAEQARKTIVTPREKEKPADTPPPQEPQEKKKWEPWAICSDPDKPTKVDDDETPKSDA